MAQDDSREQLRLEDRGDYLRITGLKELTAANSDAFRKAVTSELCGRHSNIEIDLSEIHFMDSRGLGVLIGLRNRLMERKGGVKVINPTSRIQKIFQLTGMVRVFEIQA